MGIDPIDGDRIDVHLVASHTEAAKFAKQLDPALGSVYVIGRQVAIYTADDADMVVLSAVCTGKPWPA